MRCRENLRRASLVDDVVVRLTGTFVQSVDDEINEKRMSDKKKFEKRYEIHV